MTQQIPLDQWPNSLSVDGLQLALDPDEISRRTRLEFVTDEDDLDKFQAAVVDFGEGRSFALQRYINSPARGTTVLFTPGWTGVREVIRYLKVRPAEILWVAPELALQIGTQRGKAVRSRTYALNPRGPDGKAKSARTSGRTALRKRGVAAKRRKGSGSAA